MEQPKFKVGDLVTVCRGTSVWYTHLDTLREKLLNKTGRIVSVEKQIFTKEDLEWYRVNSPEQYLEIFNYYVVFPDEPERKINMSEVHLELFKLER